MVTVAGHGDNSHNLSQVLTGANGKRVARRRLDGEEVGEGVSGLDELLNQASVDEIHSLARELSSHVHEQLAGHFRWVLEGHGVFAIVGNNAISELPDSVLQVLLVGAEIIETGVLTGIGLSQLIELLLQAREVLRRKVTSRLVPGGGKGVVKWAEEVDEHDEAVELVSERVGGIIGKRRQVDRGL